MNTFIVSAATHSGGRVEVSVENAAGDTRQVFVEANVELSREATAWVAGLTPVVMRRNADLHIEGSVDPLSVQNARKASDLLSSWFGEMSPLGKVVASGDTDGRREQPVAGIGCFFSGGVDSFYSVLKNRDRITHLIFVTGFDIPLSNDDLCQRALGELRAAAAALGLPLIEVRTNLKEMGDSESLLWGKHYHGAALSAIAQLLAPVVGRVIVPSSYHQDDLHPWGSHPDLDALWSSNRVVIEHDGVDKTRPAKVALLAEHQVALEHLRVCYLNPDGAYNCGRCEKCIRTIINLRVVGAAGRCKTLPGDVTAADLRKLRVDAGGALFVKENLAELRRLDRADPELEEALNRSLRRSFFHAAKTRLKDRLVLVLRN